MQRSGALRDERPPPRRVSLPARLPPGASPSRRVRLSNFFVPPGERITVNLDNPHFLINFKTYDGTYAEEALSYAKTVEAVAEETGATYAVAPQTVDLRLVAENTSLPVVAQSVDAAEPGRETGGVLPEAVAEAGADAV